jgi:hypothetical protein
MSDEHFTPEIFEQKEVAEKECQKLQALLNKQMPDHSFIFAPEDNEIIILDNLYLDKIKRPREIVIHEDDNDDDDDDNEDDDVPEVKPKQSSVFKRHEDDNDEDEEEEDKLADLLDNELLAAFDSQTWDIAPQSPWSQHNEPAQQNHLLVPTTTEPVIPHLYTPQGVDLYFLILSFIYIYFL